PGPEVVTTLKSALGDMDKQQEEAQALLPLLFLTVALLPLRLVAEAGGGIHVLAISAGLPVGSGLGSSAAFCVASATALMELRAKLEGEAAGDSSTAGMPVVAMGGVQGRVPNSERLSLINSWAFAAETVIHGTPSGLDNTVSTYGGALTYQKNPQAFEQGFPTLEVLLTNTLVEGRSTRVLVAKVGKMLEAQPVSTGRIFDAIEAISDSFVGHRSTQTCSFILLTSSFSLPSSWPLKVSSLMSCNHYLLCALGVGHDRLEQVCTTARKFGFSSKLTGAGGGGCAVTLLSCECVSDSQSESDQSVPDCQQLLLELEAGGFQCFRTGLGGSGV
ncbi:unnamed protein product, partial [Chrysoparadoxa australica]